jgi:hypothetical protein
VRQVAQFLLVDDGVVRGQGQAAGFLDGGDAQYTIPSGPPQHQANGVAVQILRQRQEETVDDAACARFLLGGIEPESRVFHCHQHVRRWQVDAPLFHGGAIGQRHQVVGPLAERVAQVCLVQCLALTQGQHHGETERLRQLCKHACDAFGFSSRCAHGKDDDRLGGLHCGEPFAALFHLLSLVIHALTLQFLPDT